MLPSPFSEAPRCVEADGGAGRVIWAVLHPDTPSHHLATRQMYDQLLRAMAEHSVFRVALQLVRESPSSRLFWDGLRHLGTECAKFGGILLVCFQQSDPTDGDRASNPWFVIAPPGMTDEACRAMAASLGSRPAPPPPPLD